MNSKEDCPMKIMFFLIFLMSAAALSAAVPFTRTSDFTPVTIGERARNAKETMFFAEAQLNGDLPEVQHPFTYAHEFSHLLGVSNEAEANYWAYRACTESSSTALQYCGYFGLFPYVLSNASYLLPKEDFQAWIQTVRPEVIEQYKEKNRYWQERYSPLIGSIQDFSYNLFLKGNKIASGKKNYAEVIGLLLSLQPKPQEKR